uniref:Beta-lactamase-related domain-containing protein n=1 Tax=Setaria digitata TaxID=48799 RepID=A0A915Q236_9BILA
MCTRRAAIAVIIGLIIGWIFKTPVNNSKSNGTVKKDFQSIRDMFDKILSREKEGLAFAVYKNNELIVDLWGGYAERAALREWDRDTMSLTFSTTKAIGALIIAILVSRGQLQYEDKVVKYWPEFGAHNKENTTVQWLVEHKAGLIVFDAELTIEQARDHRYISRIIEQTKPRWPTGTVVAYHALTYGWLLDQIVRRVDPLKRSVAQFFHEEIQKHMEDKDFYLGLPRNEHYRVARIVKANEEVPYNNPAVREIENVSVLGIGTARGLANVVSTIWRRNLISTEVWERISTPVEYTEDGISYFKAYRGYGFFYELHPVRPNAYVITHSGHGMQNLIIDPLNKIVAVMIRNGISWRYGALDESFALASDIIRATDH